MTNTDTSKRSLLKQALQSLASNDLETVAQLIGETDDQPLANYLRGRLSLKSGDVAAAQRFYESAAQAAERNIFFWQQLANLCFELGQREAAYAHYKKCVSLNPTNGSACRMMSLLWAAPSREDQQLLRRALQSTESSTGSSRIEIIYAAAKLLLDMGRVERGFQFLAKAGQMQKALQPWTSEGMEALTEALMQKVTASWLERNASAGLGEARPIFVIGMPRSGTSLVESILAAHPSLATIGESLASENALNGIHVDGTRFETTRRTNDWLVPLRMPLSLAERGQRYVNETAAQLAGKAEQRLIDKFPGNYMWLGLIHAILPNARFIHCARNPAASGWSQYAQYFGSELPYSYDLKDLASAYRCYDRVMMHWRDVLPAQSLITIRYEQLVTDLEASVRRLITFVGLEWSDQTLQPHKRAGRVRTASAVQVRSPVNQSSVDAWTKFRAELSPLIEHLGDSYTEFDRRWPKFTT